MLFIFNANGDVLDYVPENIYQGSNNANTIYVVAPLSSANQVLAHVTLPNGKIVSPIYATNQDNLTLLDTLVLDNTTYSIWGCKISKVVTAISGIVSISFEFINETQEISTAATNFPILEGNPPAQPFDLTTETTLQDILAYISQFITNQDSKFASLKAEIEQDFSNLETEVQNNFNELSEEILARQEILEENISQEVKKNSSDIRSIYNILEIKDILAYETIPMTTNARVTANGENIVDGAEVELKTVKGNTAKCNNLIPYPYVMTTKTENGITFTDLGNGALLVSGTATADTTFYFAYSGINLTDGQTYTPSGSVGSNNVVVNYLDGNSQNVYTSSTFTWSKNFTFRAIYITVLNGQTVNATFLPMLNTGSTALPFEPYFVGLKSATFKGVKSNGKNIFNFNAIVGAVHEASGINYLDQSAYQNGYLKINTSFYQQGPCYLIGAEAYLSAGSYTVSFMVKNNESIQMPVYAHLKNSTYNIVRYSSSTAIPGNSLVSIPINLDVGGYCKFSIIAGGNEAVPVPNIEFYNIQIENGTSTNYEPYKESIIELPEAVETGLGVTVNFENKVITESYAELTATGTENIVSIAQNNEGYNIFNFTFPNNGISHLPSTRGLISDAFTYFSYTNPTTSAAAIPLGYARWSGSALIYNFVAPFETVDEFRAWVKSLYDSGNPLKVRYITRDIQNEIPFNEQQSLVNNYYSGYDKGMETIIGNSNSESVNNTVELEYLTITE